MRSLTYEQLASLEKQKKFLNDFLSQKPEKFKTFVSSLLSYEKREISIDEVYEELKGFSLFWLILYLGGLKLFG